MYFDEEKTNKFREKLYECSSIDECNDLIRCEADLTYICFYAERLSGLDFSGKDLSGCVFMDLISSGVNFSGADLSGTFFEGVGLYHCNFYNANLSNTRMRRTGLHGSNFQNVNFANTNLNAMLAKCNIKDAVFTLNSNRWMKYVESDIISIDGVVKPIQEWNNIIDNRIPSDAIYELNDPDSPEWALFKPSYDLLKAISSVTVVEDWKDYKIVPLVDTSTQKRSTEYGHYDAFKFKIEI